MVEFQCEGCGIHVTDIIATAVPAHGFCSVCAHVNEHVPGPEGLKVLDFINRAQRADPAVTD